MNYNNNNINQNEMENRENIQVNPNNASYLERNQPIQADTNIEETYFKEWLIDIVININVWHIFLITAILCYMEKFSTLSLIIILTVYDLYDLFFLVKRRKNIN